MIQKAWDAQRDFVMMASKCKKPDQAVLGVSERDNKAEPTFLLCSSLPYRLVMPVNRATITLGNLSFRDGTGLRPRPFPSATPPCDFRPASFSLLQWFAENLLPGEPAGALSGLAQTPLRIYRWILSGGLRGKKQKCMAIPVRPIPHNQFRNR